MTLALRCLAHRLFRHGPVDIVRMVGGGAFVSCSCGGVVAFERGDDGDARIVLATCPVAVRRKRSRGTLPTARAL